VLAGEWKGIVAALGLSVRHLRHLLGWSQAELAQRAVSSQGAVSRLESGAYPDLSFHSVVVTLRALEQGAHAAAIPIVPPTRGLLDFAAGLDPHYRLARIDHDLARLVRLYHTLSPRQQTALVTFVNAFTRPPRKVDNTEAHQWTTL
jgi:transcriptional regulator with XRE-family HTH domain